MEGRKRVALTRTTLDIGGLSLELLYKLSLCTPPEAVELTIPTELLFPITALFLLLE
jgi:hypothetical protein